MNLHPLNKIKLAGTIIALVAVALVIGIKAPDHVNASLGDNVHGWAWSDMPTGSNEVLSPSNSFGGRGLGYISMNSDDPGMSGSYGVKIDMNTGELSGRAWSAYGGWLDFDALGPYPPYNASTSAKVMPSCWAQQVSNPGMWCNVIGWARFTAGGTAQAGGWDGWVGMNSDFAPAYHVAYQRSTGDFQGKAWGGPVAGWVDFDNVTSVPASLSCADPVTGTVYTYTDPANPPVQCQLPLGLVCYSPAGVAYSYAAGSPMPSACTPPPDLCTNLTGIQSILPTFINGVWYNDPNNDKICTKMAHPPVFGCTDSTADNFNPLATIDDGSCTYTGGGGGGNAPKKPIYKEN